MMKMGSRTRPDRSRPRKTQKMGRKTGKFRKIALTLIRDRGAYWYKLRYADSHCANARSIFSSQLMNYMENTALILVMIKW